MRVLLPQLPGGYQRYPVLGTMDTHRKYIQVFILKGNYLLLPLHLVIFQPVRIHRIKSEFPDLSCGKILVHESCRVI